MLNKLKRAALGAHTPHDKATAASKPVPMPLPAQVRILMSQHIGAPAKALVKKGDEVFVGTKIGEAGGFVSANIHSSVSGTVAAVEPFRLSNGRMCDSVVIKTDGKQTVDPAVKAPEVTDKASFLKAVRDCGLVGLGGAGFPTDVKLQPKQQVDTLLINASECEVWLTSDTQEMLNCSDDIIRGIKAVLQYTGIPKCVIGIAAKSGYARSKLLMPLVFAAAMGGNLSLIGAPGNLIAQSALGEIGMSFGFFEYAIVGLPILAAGILFYATLGMKLLPNHPVSDDDSFGGEQDFSNVPKWKQVLSLVILVLTLLGMIFEKQIGIKLCITGCIGALALILTGVISEKDALKSIDLKTIFLFGGTLSLASALDKTGAGAEIANIVIGALGENPSPYVLTLVVFLLCCVMTNFMSNTATTALMVPICLSIAQGMGADPRAVLMACVIGGSCAYATPIGMPANTMVVSAGGYTFKDYAKAGLPLILIATVVSMVILPIAFPFFPQ